VSFRILVVDDDSATLRVLARLLTGEGHSPVTCATPLDALTELGRSHYDVLLSDLVMPEMSGVDLVRAAKERQPVLRCFIMSGHMPVDGQDDGVVWVDKPIDIDELLVKLG